MKKWPLFLVLCCLFLIVMLILNVQMRKEKQAFVGSRVSEQKNAQPTTEPGPGPLDTGRRVQQLDKERERTPPEFNIRESEVSEVKLEEQIRRAEALKIKPTEEEMQELKRRNVIIY